MGPQSDVWVVHRHLSIARAISRKAQFRASSSQKAVVTSKSLGHKALDHKGTSQS